MWPQNIEDAYQAWIDSPTLSSHRADENRFYKFVWSCIDNPDDAPSGFELVERLTTDLGFKSDYKHFVPGGTRETASKSQFLEQEN
jgi:hypothetical protein